MLNSDSKEALLSFDTEKELYSFKVRKNDFAEENARSRRLFKKKYDYDRVEIIDIEMVRGDRS